MWEATLAPLVAAVVDRLPYLTAKLLSWHLASLGKDDPNVRDKMPPATMSPTNSIVSVLFGAGAACKAKCHSDRL